MSRMVPPPLPLSMPWCWCCCRCCRFVSFRFTFLFANTHHVLRAVSVCWANFQWSKISTPNLLRTFCFFVYSFGFYGGRSVSKSSAFVESSIHFGMKRDGQRCDDRTNWPILKHSHSHIHREINRCARIHSHVCKAVVNSSFFLLLVLLNGTHLPLGAAMRSCNMSAKKHFAHDHHFFFFGKPNPTNDLCHLNDGLRCLVNK